MQPNAPTIAGKHGARIDGRCSLNCQLRSKNRPRGGVKSCQGRYTKRHDARARQIAGARHGAFLPRLVVPEGSTAGKKLRLATYQKDFVRGAFAKGIHPAMLETPRTSPSAPDDLRALLSKPQVQPMA